LNINLCKILILEISWAEIIFSIHFADKRWTPKNLALHRLCVWNIWFNIWTETFNSMLFFFVTFPSSWFPETEKVFWPICACIALSSSQFYKHTYVLIVVATNWKCMCTKYLTWGQLNSQGYLMATTFHFINVNIRCNVGKGRLPWYSVNQIPPLVLHWRLNTVVKLWLSLQLMGCEFVVCGFSQVPSWCRRNRMTPKPLQIYTLISENSPVPNFNRCMLYRGLEVLISLGNNDHYLSLVASALFFSSLLIYDT